MDYLSRIGACVEKGLYYEAVRLCDRALSRGKGDLVTDNLRSIADAINRMEDPSAIIRQIENGRWKRIGIETEGGRVTLVDRGKRPFWSAGRRRTASRAFALVILLAVSCLAVNAYTDAHTEVPMTSLSLESDTEMAWAGNDVVITAVIEPFDTSNRDLVWRADVPGVTIGTDGDAAVVSIPPSASDGTLTVTATSERYGISSVIQLEIVNEISVDVSASRDGAAAGDVVSMTASVTGTDRVEELIWRTDRAYALCVSDGLSAEITLGPEAVAGDTVTVTASIPGGGICGSAHFNVTEGCGLTLESSVNRLSAGEEVVITARVGQAFADRGFSWSAGDEFEWSADGDTLTARVPYDSEEGTEWTVTVNLGDTGASSSLTLRVQDALGIDIYGLPSEVVAGNTVVLDATVGPVAPPDSRIVWKAEIDGTEIPVTSGDYRVSVWIPEDSPHGSVLTVTAKLTGYGVSCTAEAAVSNVDLIPIEISNAEDFVRIATDPSRVYVITEDVDLSGIEWTPFVFTGELRGGGHSVTGLSVDMVHTRYSSNIYGGLFSVNHGTIRDLTLVDPDVVVAPENTGKTVTVRVGSLAGENTGIIEGCTVTGGHVNGYSTDIPFIWKEKTGLEVPRIHTSRWSDWCKLHGFTGVWVNDWSSNKKMAVYAGGITGSNSGTVDGCDVFVTEVFADVLNFNFSSDKSRDAQEIHAGGIAGTNEGRVFDCSTTSPVRAEFDLHDSGDGSKGGLGYVGSMRPAAVGYVGKIVGSGSEALASGGYGTVSYWAQVYAPPYLLFTGADYGSGNKAYLDNVNWHV